MTGVTEKDNTVSFLFLPSVVVVAVFFLLLLGEECLRACLRACVRVSVCLFFYFVGSTYGHTHTHFHVYLVGVCTGVSFCCDEIHSFTSFCYKYSVNHHSDCIICV